MATGSRWLFSARTDLVVFLGSAVVALGLFALAPAVTSSETPGWAWIGGVLLVDVAHVWSTAFVVYLDPTERARRPALYIFVPLIGWLVGVALYAHGEATFWRVLAYLAVFHFVRQQYGWVRMYRGRAGERDRAGAWLDGATVYAATLYPLLWWHAHLPRDFAWFRDGDFAGGVPVWLADAAGIVYLALLALYATRAVLAARLAPVNWGKHIVVATTAACWYLGIVVADGDYTFTITNVLIHGVPYLALVYVYARRVGHQRADLGARLLRRGLVVFLATVWALAYLEELVWDRAVWNERPWLFGGGTSLDDWHLWLVPLLAVPQLTHYVLDAFLWRRASNPRLAEAFGPGSRIPGRTTGR